MKYRKKPVVIEAFQMTKETYWPQTNWPSWLKQAWENDTVAVHSGGLVIVTLEGTMLVGTDDFIIQGVQGELYPCKPDIFEATYEEVK
jgi:hypothetical protein